MKSAIWAGESIDRFIPPHLRNTFYKSPNSKYARNNGIGAYDFSTNGLVLYLPLWALQGNPIQSIDAFRRSGTITGAFWTPKGRNFDGTDDSIDCGSLASKITNQLTLEYWIKFDALVASFFHAGHVQLLAGGYDWAMLNTAGYLVSFYCVNAAGVDPGGAPTGITLSTNTWYHLVGTYDGANLRGYGNGVYGGTPFAQTGNVRDSGYTFIMGRSNNLEVDGLIGELRVYNRALSAVEVLRNFQATQWRYK